MEEKYMIVGAFGIIGYPLLRDLLNLEEREVVAVDDLSYSHYGLDLDAKNRIILVDEPFWEFDNLKWQDIIIENNISRIYWCDSIENINRWFPDEDQQFIRERMHAESRFAEALKSLEIEMQNRDRKLEILFLSSDKIYLGDEFPNELSNFKIYNSENENTPSVFLRFSEYIYKKLITELQLLKLDPQIFKIRIIRPFSLVWGDAPDSHPLVALIKDVFDDKGILIADDGLQGVAFTDIRDLITFILSPKLFDDEISNKFLARTFNFCRTENYLTTAYLARTVIKKLEKNVTLSTGEDVDYFNSVVNTPQIRNISLIQRPVIPIERIIEDLQKIHDPVSKYKPLVIERIDIIDSNVIISGAAEPYSTIVIEFFDGVSETTECDAEGNFVIEHEYPFDYSSVAIVYATTNDLVQYATEVIEIDV